MAGDQLIKSRDVLQRIDRLYYGSKIGDSAVKPVGCSSSMGLVSLSQQLSTEVKPPRSHAVLLVVGNQRSGKSSFVNAMAEELVIPVTGTSSSSSSERRRRPALEWVISDDLAEGFCPRLLLQATEKFPKWAASAASIAKSSHRVAGSSLHGIEIVEVMSLEDLNEDDQEATKWIASQADVIVCMLDSQNQPAASDELLQWLAALSKSDSSEGPALQFLFSKTDLLVRESDRIRLMAKASKALTEHLGRGFEILPVSSGDLGAILDSVDAAFAEASGEIDVDLGNKKLDAGRERALRAIQECANRHLDNGLEALDTDCTALQSVLKERVAQAQVASAQAAPGGASKQIALCGLAFLLIAAAMPYILDEDEVEMKQVSVIGSVALACVLFVVALLFRCAESAEGLLPVVTVEQKDLSVLQEQERFVNLIARQRESWTRRSGEENLTEAAASSARRRAPLEVE
eukprot:TRINITY_DN11547_c1_g1_i1.p1 TRINITY_DN11547_c1_g1~~TRINITY_DN11547_c1_g1_i1.p1  ORF type:complete len:493 (+),score=83.86 TRINITY_DN11547_c1_g1_i1:97-1479(+)